MSKTKILHIAPAFQRNGGGIYEVVENLSLVQGYIASNEVDILCSNKNFQEREVKRNLRNYLPLAFTDIVSVIDTFNFCYKNLESYSVIHIHGAWSLQFILILPFLSKYKNKIIYQPHGLLDPIRSKKSWMKKRIAWYLYQKYFIINCSCLIACSQKEKSELTLLSAKKINISVIPNGIDSEFFTIAANGARLERNRILFLSQIIPIKNIESIISAISIMKYVMDIEVYLDIYGYGTSKYINKLIQLSVDLRVQDNIIFKGPIERKNRVNVYDKYHHFIMPSLSENFGIVVLEALIRGCNVITSDMTPWRDFEHGNLIITKVDSQSLASTLSLILGAKVPRKCINSANKFLDVFEYKWESLALSFNRCYIEFCKN